MPTTWPDGVIGVVCADEARFQILERVPIRRAIPGSIEQREFEYKAARRK